MRCNRTASALPALVDPDGRLSPSLQNHVDHCLHCQAQVAQYRRLLRVMHSLRSEVIDPGPDMVFDIVDRLAEAGDRDARSAVLGGRRAAYLGGIAAATAAGAAGALVIASRTRRDRLRLAG